MSRAYRIRISESLERVVHVEDGVQTQLELLPVLAPERMRAHLEAELARRGFTVDSAAGHASRLEPDGVVVAVELASGAVTVSIEEERAVAAAIERTAAVDQRQAEAARERLTRHAREELERRVGDQQEAARVEATKRLEGRLRDLHGELAAIGNRVTAEALKERAAEIGEIESVSEADDGSVTISIKV